MNAQSTSIMAGIVAIVLLGASIFSVAGAEKRRQQLNRFARLASISFAMAIFPILSGAINAEGGEIALKGVLSAALASVECAWRTLFPVVAVEKMED